jgi:hypothetical protein
MTLGMVLGCLLALQIKHLVADYLFQTSHMFLNKGSYGHPGGILHAGFHAGLTIMVLALFGVPFASVLAIGVVEFIIHYHIDWTKEKLGKRAGLKPDNVNFWRMHGLDQALHQVTYLAIIWWVFA